MAKPDKTDAALAALLDALDVGRVVLLRPTFAALRESGHVELGVATRGGFCVYVAETLAEAADEARRVIENGEDEPVSPAWRRLARMQREIVTEALSEARARHMRLAAEANVEDDARSAAAEYAKADAFNAALAELEFIPTDEHDVELPTEKLEPVRPIQPRTKRAT